MLLVQRIGESLPSGGAVGRWRRNGLATSAYGVIMAASFVEMDEVAGQEEYKWLKSNPNIMKAGKMICRLMNDIVSHEVWFLNPKKINKLLDIVIIKFSFTI